VRCLFAEEFLAAPPWEALEHRSAEAQPEGEVGDKLLKADNLRVYYPVAGQGVFSALQPKKRKYVKAVDDVSIQLRRGWTLGVVGESGCGKSTLARALVGLEPLKDGEIEFMGLDISQPLRKRTIATIRELQMVFQNPDGVLNPSYTIGNQIAMPLRRFKVVPPDQVYNRVVQLLRSVKLDESYYRRFPRQLSGGEKQRVGIARAIAASPSVLVCDEPVSSLDVSVQASIVMLLSEIQEQHNMSMILISHDLSTVRFLSNYVVVMYLGRIVEEGPSERIYSPPFHPYTAALMAAVPRPNARVEPAGFRLSGTVPSAVNPPQGCCFHTRCPLKIGEICEVQVPPVHDLGGGHKVYCHLPVEALPRK
jgi:peptide/nickel transport system ATP-binding protein